MPKIAILGAGSIGCFAGISWVAAGLDVVFIGRRAIADALQDAGGRISDGEFCVTVTPYKITFFDTPEILAEADIVVLAVKMTDDDAAAADIRRYAKPGALVLSLQNGIDNAARLAPMLPGFEIVDGMVPFNVIRPSAAHFKKASKGHVMAGRNPKLEALFGSLDGPATMEFRDDIRAVKWSKLLLNLNNALNALSGLPLYDQLSLLGWRLLLAGAQRECLAVMSAEKIVPARVTPLPPAILPAFMSMPDWIFKRTGLKMMKFDRHARSSMAMDFAAGRRTEIDFLNGAVLDHAARHGIPCPVNATAVRLVREAENGGRKVWSAEEFQAEVQKTRGH